MTRRLVNVLDSSPHEMTMREKIARALHASRYGADAWDDWMRVGEGVDRYWQDADAALNAIRHPTPEMISTGRKTAIDQSYRTRFPSNDNIAAPFAAMIDAAKRDGMTNYVILAAETSIALEHLVCDYLEKGWRPHGGVSFDTNRKEFLQAMIKG